MPVRRLLPLAAAAAALVLASAGCADQSAAVRIGDRSYSDADFRDELETVAGSDALLALYGFDRDTVRGSADTSDSSELGSYSQDFVRVVLNQRVTALLAEELLDSEGIEITDQDRAAVEGALEQDFQSVQGSLSDLPEDYREDLVEGFTAQQKASDEIEDLNSQVTALSNKVRINSRYGSWDTREGVTPPAGPEPANGDG